MIKICIVGFGGMGTVHYNNYQHIEDVKVTCIVGYSEADEKRAEEKGVKIYKSLNEAYDNEEFDVVDICTPTYLHKEGIIEAANLKKHVIVEKPIALNKDDALEIFENVESNNVNIYVGFVLQFTKEYQKLHELVKNETYGKVLDAYFTRISAVPGWAKDGWLFDKDKSGLVPFDLHIHDLDIIISLFGKPHSFDSIKNKRTNSTFTEHYRINYKYDNLNVTAEAGWLHSTIPFTATFRIYFENASLIYDGKSLIAYPFEQEPLEYNITDDVLIPTGINIPPTGWYYNELKHFIECIKENKKSKLISKEQLIDTLEILESIE